MWVDKPNNLELNTETKQTIYWKEKKGTFPPSETWKRVENVKNEEYISENLSSIDNKKFLELPREKRLWYITEPNFEYKNVKENSLIKFNFTFDGKFNESLYLRTTAWQVLPPEVNLIKISDWEIYKRNWLYWEFFNEKMWRLTIHQWTEIIVQKYSNKTIWENWKEITIQEREKEFEKKALEYWENSDLALESLKRWFNPKSTQELFKDIDKWNSRKVDIEYKLTEIERAKDYFHDDFYWKSITQNNWELSPEFLAYYLNLTETDENKKYEILNSLWLKDRSKDLISDYKRLNYKWYTREIMSNKDMEEIMKNLSDVPDEYKKERFNYQFIPWSKEAQKLFLYACNAAKLPKEWAFSDSLHKLLEKESNWRVWIANYTFKYKVSSPEQFKEIAVKNSDVKSWEISRSLWVRSNATWLWQMLLSNIDKYYPDWRKWIWIPINEAIWMLKYIEDRYWNPEIANNMHWKLWTYNHPKKWNQSKNFKEWY